MNIRLIKYILGALAIIFALTGCSKNSDELASVATAQTNYTPRLKVRGDNLYDLLGFGCDATRPYLDQKKAAYPVIDVVKLKAETGFVTSDDNVHSVLDIQAGSDAKTLLTKYNNKFTLEGGMPIGGIPFTATLSTEFTGSNTTTTKYSYAFADMNAYVSHHTIKQFTPVSTLQNYLTDNFKNDLLTLTPAQIISLYGTHVYTDIYTGGKMRFTYKSYVNNSTKESSATYGAKVGLTAATNTSLSLSATTSYTVTSASDFQQESMSYYTIGGTSASALGTWTPGSGTTPTINFNQWSQTVSKSNAYSLQLMDIGDSSLVAIYEFVADPIIKVALKTAVNNYILSKGITVLPVIPLYRYCNSNNNHFYTTNWNELGIGGLNSWKYEGIQAFIFQNQEANTVPFYRFCKTTKKNTGLFSYTTYYDHYYTTVKSSGDNSGYKYEGIIGYVYATSSLNAIPTVGLRQYYNSSIHDHSYTTSSTEFGGGWSFNGDCCYVVDGTR